MSDNLGPGVSRVLDPAQRNFTTVIWQQGKPPLDSELTLMQQIAEEWQRSFVTSGCPSGWLGDAANPLDSYVTDPTWSNWLKFGPQRTGEKHAIPTALVNGWVVPVTGTLTGSPPGSPNDTATYNRLTLNPPPSNSGDSRIDFVFLEVWQARIPANPGITNKPAASAIYRYGNVEGGYSFIADDLQDPALGFETTQRVQLQYRIRVVSNVLGLSSYPDGFDPTTVKAQGAGSTPGSFVFTNMRQELGDPGLWRAGDGNTNSLGTVDGYTYAVPICAVFRRNSASWDGDPGQNLNGGFNRNPVAIDRTGYKTFATVPTLASDLSASAVSLTLSSVTDIPLPATPATPVVIQLGDELLTYTSITGTTVTGLIRGTLGSKAEPHKTGTVVKVLSGRPDGLFSDQIAKTDVLDLRHTVSPGGFDYTALLKANLDRVLRGNLHANWKRSGAGPQGIFLAYQDKISASPGALGVTKLDSPDGIRQVFSDAAMCQPVVIPITVPGGTGPAVSVGGTLGNAFTVTANASSGGYAVGNSLSVPLSQFTTSLPGSDIDQITFIADTAYVKLRFMGETSDLSTSHYSTAVAGGSLVITFVGGFGSRTKGAFVTVYLQYGPGRGLSRRPDAVHSVAYLSGSPEIIVQQQGVPSDNQVLRTTWAPLWSKFRSATFNGRLPSTSECYVDPGSKTVILTPFRLQNFSGPKFTTIQTHVNTGAGSDATLGAMPSNNLAGSAKWGTTDPLGIFSGYTDTLSSRANMTVVIPRRYMPGWGEVRTPILYSTVGSVNQGVNFGIHAPEGSAPGNGVTTYVPLTSGGGSATYAIFSTTNFLSNTPATYNAAFTFGNKIAGMRFFTDARSLGRKGLELPPFYGIARMFGIYEAQDYKDNGSSFDASSRASIGTGAVNLMRQNLDGPAFWIELDTDKDSTFVINADLIDITRSPNAISSFETGNYVIEASIFGFDRGAFDLSQDCRLVLSRTRTEGTTAASEMTTSLPKFVLPGAPIVGDEIAINYSREPYQGDAWNSQSDASDTGYEPGSLTTAVRYQLISTQLDQAHLARPNPKTLEVLAGMSFLTTLGTGRLSGDIPSNADDFRNVGFEIWSLPTSAVDPRPTTTTGTYQPAEKKITVGTEYSGCTTRLPLGALFRDKDFRGNAVGGPSGDLRQLLTMATSSPGSMASGLANPQNSEYVVVPAYNASIASGNAGEIVVQVDGSEGNYGVLTNYRTNRGGSAFTVSGNAGGDLGAVLTSSTAAASSGGVLSGIALLVRNLPTVVGATEVSGGGELMLLIATTAKVQDFSGSTNAVQINTAGTGESYSASDLYRIAGHPLTIDNARTSVDPTTIVLSGKSDLL